MHTIVSKRLPPHPQTSIMGGRMCVVCTTIQTKICVHIIDIHTYIMMCKLISLYVCVCSFGVSCNIYYICCCRCSSLLLKCQSGSIDSFFFVLLPTLIVFFRVILFLLLLLLCSYYIILFYLILHSPFFVLVAAVVFLA